MNYDSEGQPPFPKANSAYDEVIEGCNSEESTATVRRLVADDRTDVAMIEPDDTAKNSVVDVEMTANERDDDADMSDYESADEMDVAHRVIPSIGKRRDITDQPLEDMSISLTELDSGEVPQPPTRDAAQVSTMREDEARGTVELPVKRKVTSAPCARSLD